MSTNSVPSYDSFTLSGSYDFSLKGSTKLQLFATIDNLFNRDPPVAVGSGFGGNGNGGTNCT